jgi:predicted molibdopterin-dependent oxidoreductase YjgC
MPDAPAPNFITVTINGQAVTVPRGSTVAAVLLNSSVPCRISECGEPRAPLCGMGICFECRAAVDGVPHRRTCQIECRPGMTVETQP